MIGDPGFPKKFSPNWKRQGKGRERREQKVVLKFYSKFGPTFPFI